MSVELFNKRIIAAQEKLFDSEVLVTGCVYDLLKEFHNSRAEIYAEVPYLDRTGGYRSIIVDSVYLDDAAGAISAACSEGTQIVWDDFDLSAKEIIMNELFIKYSSDAIYNDFSAGDEIH